MNTEKFEQLVEKFKITLDITDNHLQMNSFAIKQNGDCFIYRFNNRMEASDVRSLSKTVMALVTGKVFELSKQGVYPKIGLDTNIFPIIEKLVNLNNIKNLTYLKQINIKHLLTHTIGYDKMLLMRGDIIDLDPFSYLDYLINYPIKYQPGTVYLYSNAGFYLLSVILQEFINEDLFAFVKRELFEPLEINNANWIKYGNYLAGATRLWLQPEDLIKIGELLLNDGTYKGKQILPKSWIKEMTTIQEYNPNYDLSNRKHLLYYAYGYGIWLNKKEIYFASGTDGQYIVIVPEKKAIIITQAQQKDPNPIRNIIDEIIENYL